MIGKSNIVFLFLFFYLSVCAGNKKDNITIVSEKKETIVQVKPHSLGLQVDNKGVLTLHGNQFRGVGVNYFNAFYRTLKTPALSDTSYIEGFKYLKAQHIPFVRFMACAFWPKEWNLYLTNKAEYFAKLDKLVHSAEHYGIGLIPSLFWFFQTVPDLVGEPVNQWGNPDSKTIHFMRTYTTEMVKRYKDSPAIWGWEFSNEVNLLADLPGEHLPQIAVGMGTPSVRTVADKISTADMNIALKEFVKTIRKYDASRIIFSGNSIPRESAYNLSYNKTWDNDKVSQYIQMLDIQNPDPLNSITIHLYPEPEAKRFADKPVSLKEVIRLSMGEANNKKKTLFIGEFGVSKASGAKERAGFTEMLAGIEEYKVSLAALWVFDYSPQDADWNVTPNNNRKYMLEEIGALNDRISNAITPKR